MGVLSLSSDVVGIAVGIVEVVAKRGKEAALEAYCVREIGTGDADTLSACTVIARGAIWGCALSYYSRSPCGL
jgi:hypothetical protein